MKKGQLKKFLAGTLMASLTLSSVAFAADTTTKSMSVTYGGMAATLNGKEISLKDASNKSVEMITYNKVNYLPIQPIAKALGWTMSYDTKTKSVTLKAPTTTKATTSTEVATKATTGTDATTSATKTHDGNPPAGDPPTGTSSTNTPPTDSTANNAKITKTKAVTKKISVIYGQKYTVNSKVVTLANTKTATVVGFTYNSVVYLPIKGVEQIFGLKSSVDTKNAVIMFSGGVADKGANANTTGQSTAIGTAVYSATNSVGTLTDKTYTATKANESGVKVSKGGSLSLTNGTVTKTGDSTAVETSNFTGLNAGILVENSGQLTLNDAIVTTDAEGSNAIVSTGDGSKVIIDGIVIKTSKDSSRGLHATYNGTIVATDVNIYTKGAHSGALTTDRGEGTVTVTGGTLLTEGEGSPGIYSTGNITATNITSTAKGSEAAVIEGKNAITLVDSILSGAKKWGVMIYQSFSGDAGTGTGTFTMTGGSLSAAVGPLFYATNTSGVINLNQVELSQVSGVLIQADGNNQWGTKGSNGANLVVTANHQVLSGNINADAISTVKMTLKNNSALTGGINSDHTAKFMALTLDESSSWNVSADSYISTLTDADADLSNIIDNGHNVYYDAAQSANSWLEEKTYTLSGGGKLMPATSK